MLASSNFDQKKPQFKTGVHSLPCEEGVSFPSRLVIRDQGRTEHVSDVILDVILTQWLTG